MAAAATPKGARVYPVTRAIKAAKFILLNVGLVSFVINLLMLTGPLFMLQVYDRVLTSRSIPTLLALAGIAIGLYAFYGLLEGLRGRILARLGRYIDERLSPAIFTSTILLPLHGGRSGARLDPARDLETARQFLSGPGPAAFFDLPWMPVYMAALFLFHPVIGLVATGGALVLCVLTLLNELLTQKITRHALGKATQRRVLADDARTNAESIMAMGMAQGLRSRWLVRGQAFHQAQSLASDRAGTFSTLTKTLRFVLQSAILGVGAYFAIQEVISPGIMIAASIITSRALAPIEQIVGQWRGFIGARQALKRLNRVLAAQPDSQPQTELPLPTQSLSAEGVTVSAPGHDKPIVKRVSFALKSGDGLGIIGPSGSGKSTLARALIGVWPYANGAVRLDGATLDQWAPDHLGAAIGYLPQEVQLFAGTVAENIARFNPNPDPEKILSAAELASAHELIAGLPDGYDTQVGENGAALSGGQRQRIALARAIYGNPFLIVLDEPNANLDAAGDNALLLALRAMRANGSIVIVIAHRPSGLAAVDDLLVLADGQVKALGPRDHVLSQVTTNKPSAQPGAGVLDSRVNLTQKEVAS